MEDYSQTFHGITLCQSSPTHPSDLSESGKNAARQTIPKPFYGFPLSSMYLTHLFPQRALRKSGGSRVRGGLGRSGELWTSPGRSGELWRAPGKLREVWWGFSGFFVVFGFVDLFGFFRFCGFSRFFGFFEFFGFFGFVGFSDFSSFFKLVTRGWWSLTPP